MPSQKKTQEVSTDSMLKYRLKIFKVIGYIFFGISSKYDLGSSNLFMKSYMFKQHICTITISGFETKQITS